MLSQPEHLTETGPALWAMLQEVVALYNVDGDVVLPERWCVMPERVPALGAVVADDEQIVIGRHEMDRLFETASGRYEGTLDAGPLAERVHALLAERGVEPAALHLVTDQELTPPPEWRYILWDGKDDWGVVSLAPMDPNYWGMLTPDRTRQIKSRARAASISHVGELLGLERCKNPRCFLFANVDSVLRLDRMISIGKEHPEFAHREAIGYSSRDGADLAAPEPLLGSEGLGSEEWTP
jgi:hypothetical protein